MVTGEAAPAEKIACLTQYGADEYLLKPIKLADLMACIEKLIVAPAAGTGQNSKVKPVKNVLVIDDDYVSQRIVTSFIKQGGNICTCCKTIGEAKEEWQKSSRSSGTHKYDLILLDNELPDGKGVDFMEFLRKSQTEGSEPAATAGKRQPPVVSMSGNAISDQQRAYEGYEMYAFLQKPIPKAVLNDIINSAS